MLSAARFRAGVVGLVALAGLVTACSAPAGATGAGPGQIDAVGAENQYADVIAQVGGAYVHVAAVESNPNTDPHTFEASARVSRQVAAARTVVQNGVGYDGYMDKIEAATPSGARRVISVQRLLGLPDDTPNPHLWYDPATMPAVARSLVGALSALQPAHAAYFRNRAVAFDASLTAWNDALATFRTAHPHLPVATTEPVGDDLLAAAGTRDLTPFSLQAAVMNGTDPSPEDVTAENNLLRDHRVAVLVYNQQVTDALTRSFLQTAKRAGIPVVGMYETMPTPGYDYQSWMLAETSALNRAVTDRASTQKL